MEHTRRSIEMTEKIFKNFKNYSYEQIFINSLKIM